jgi:hypothetical protein
LGADNILYYWDGSAWMPKTRSWVGVAGQIQVSPPVGTYQLTASEPTGGASGGWSWYAAVSNGDTELWELQYDGTWHQITASIDSGYGYIHPVPSGKVVKFMSSSYGTVSGAMQLVWDDTLYVTRSDSLTSWQPPTTSGANPVAFIGTLPAGSAAVGQDRWKNIIVAIPIP